MPINVEGSSMYEYCKELLQLKYEILLFCNNEASFIGTLKSKYSNLDFANWKTLDTPEIRNVYGMVASKHEWYKSESSGRKIGEIISEQIGLLAPETHLKK